MMRGTSEAAALADARSREGVRAASRRRWWIALAVVALTYTIVLLVVTVRIPFGWDETVYAGQVARGVPAPNFSAPRARGIPLLLTPVATVTSSVTALRVYLSLLSGAGLFTAYLPWLRLRNGPAVPLAAALFAGLWLSLFYGNEAMPNLWVAYSGVAGTGLFCLAWRRLRTLAAPAGVVAAFAVASLVRPTDASWLALPLVAYGLARRRPGPALAAAAGVAIGWAEWCVEAFLRYGGPAARLRAAGAINDTGLHFMLAEHLRALDGPLLCRFGTSCGGFPRPQIAWFAVFVLLAVVGAWAARRRGGPVLALVTGLSLGASYVFTVGYAAPRFLLPMYALLALPVAEAVAALSRPRVMRPLMAAALVAHFTLQAVTFAGWARYENDNRDHDRGAAAALRAIGLRAPCLVYGHHAVQIGYLDRCASVGVFTNYGGAKPPASIRAALARNDWVGVVSNHRTPPAAYLDTWTRVPIKVGPGTTWYAYLPR